MAGFSPSTAHSFVTRLCRRQHLALDKGSALLAELFFRVLRMGQQRVSSAYYPGKVPVSVGGKRLGPEDYPILATTLAPENALRLYGEAGRLKPHLQHGRDGASTLKQHI